LPVQLASDKDDFDVINEPFLFPIGIKSTTIEKTANLPMLKHSLDNSDNYSNSIDMLDDYVKNGFLSKETAFLFREQLYKSENNFSIYVNNHNNDYE
jgi:hypothetical protein